MPRPTRSGLKVLAVGLLMLAPVLYVLSIGPAYRFVFRDFWTMDLADVDSLNQFYAPLWWVGEHVRPFGWALTKYTKFHRNGDEFIVECGGGDRRTYEHAPLPNP